MFEYTMNVLFSSGVEKIYHCQVNTSAEKVFKDAIEELKASISTGFLENKRGCLKVLSTEGIDIIIKLQDVSVVEIVL